MHTFTGENGTTIHYNSDGSGSAFVSGPTGVAIGIAEVPCSDLIQFVAELVRAERIAKLEHGVFAPGALRNHIADLQRQTAREILGLVENP